MPLQTFYNLNPERRKEIIDVSFGEFALHPYTAASLGNIIRKLGIAKGSFYRYFKNKQDLYLYLIDFATGARLEEVEELFTNPKITFSQLIVQNFAAKIRFDMKNPLISGFLYNVSRERNNEEVGNIQLKIKKKVLDLVIDLLEQHKKSWKPSNRVPLFDMAFLIMQVQLGVFDYLELKYGISIWENVKAGKTAFPLDEDLILNDIHSFATLMEFGIKGK